MPASAPPSPDELLAQYRAQGDPEALGALFDAVAPTLHRIALSLLSDVHDADDALQATFLALLQHPDRPDPDRPVVPWLVGVLRNEVLRLRRASRHRDAPPAPSVDANAALADDADVRKALEELPEPYRAPSLLRWRYGLTPAEIAHVRDEPPGTTRSLLARALSQLRRKLRGKLLGAGPLAGGLDGVREAVLGAASHARASAARATMWSSLMTTKNVVLATLAGAVALAADVAWFTAGPSDARSTRGDYAHVAHPREVARQPERPPEGFGVASAPVLEGTAARLPPVRPASGTPTTTRVTVRAQWVPSGTMVEGVQAWWDGGGSLSADAASVAVAVPREGVEIALPARGGGRLVGRCAEGAWASCVVAEGQLNAKLEFSESISVSGTLRQRSGAPFQGFELEVAGRGSETPARLEAVAPPYALRAERVRVRTDGEGKFSVRGLTSRSVTLRPVRPDMELARTDAWGPRRGVVVNTPAVNVELVAFAARRLKLSIRDDETGLPVPAPLDLQVSPWPEGLTGACLIADGVRSAAELLWPTDAQDGGSVSLECKAPGYASASVSLNPLSIPLGEEYVIRLHPTDELRGSLRLGVPAAWSDPPNVLRVTMTPQGSDAGISCNVVRIGGEWIVPSVPPGRYDLSFAGVRLLADVRVEAGRVVSIQVPASAALVRLWAVPRFLGQPVAGTFGFQVMAGPRGLWGGVGIVQDSGLLDLGLHAAGDKLVVNVTRDGEISAPTIVVVQAAEDGAMRVEIPLLERLTPADLPPGLR